MPQFCPLLLAAEIASGGPPEHEPTWAFCRDDECAWWKSDPDAGLGVGMCAIWTIAAMLQDLRGLHADDSAERGE